MTQIYSGSVLIHSFLFRSIPFQMTDLLTPLILDLVYLTALNPPLLLTLQSDNHSKERSFCCGGGFVLFYTQPTRSEFLERLILTAFLDCRLVGVLTMTLDQMSFMV